MIENDLSVKALSVCLHTLHKFRTLYTFNIARPVVDLCGCGELATLLHAGNHDGMERIVHLENLDPRILFGANNVRLRQLKDYFPKLKVTARGEVIKWEGPEADVLALEEKIDLIFRHIERFDVLTEAQLERIVLDDKPSILKNLNGHNDVIVNGVGGLLIKARTANQRKMVEAVETNDLVFAMGPAGTGKTYTAVALAVRALKNKAVRRVVLTRPAVEAGESLGFLPGDMKEKLDPYMQPLYDALRDMIPAERLAQFLENGTIEIAPLAFMRGRTLDRAFVILESWTPFLRRAAMMLSLVSGPRASLGWALLVPAKMPRW